VILGTVTITLITGANKGLGREAARRLLKVGHTVLVGARDAERGQRTANELGAVFLQIDPTSDASVAAATELVRSEYGRLDVLVNNAGTAEPRVGAADLTADMAMQGFGITCSGPSGSRTRSCLSCAPRIIPGSSTCRAASGPSHASSHPARWRTQSHYRSIRPTKAALTMLTVQYARALDGILVNAADPGFTGTDFNDNRGT